MSSAIRIVRPTPNASPTLTPLPTPNSPNRSAPSPVISLNATIAPFSVKTAANAPVFIPTSTSTNTTATVDSLSNFVEESNTAANGGGAGMGAGAQEFVPRRVDTPALSEDSPFYSPATAPGGAELDDSRVEELAEYYGQAADLNGNYELQPRLGDLQHPGSSGEEAMYDYNQLSNPGDVYYQGQAASTFLRQPLQYHLYHSSPAHTSVPTSQSFFLPPSLHTALSSKSEATHSTPSVDMKLPEEVGGYTGLMPLDKSGYQAGNGDGAGGWGGYRSWIYKAWKADGKAYALRRIEGFRLQHEASITVVEKWTRIRHPGLVSVREAFTTRAFGDHSIIFVYDFHAASITLYEAHLSPLASLPPNPWSSAPHHHNPHFQTAHSYRGTIRHNLPASSLGGGLAERIIWSYIVQLGSMIKAVHNAGLAVRNLEVNRILVTGVNRLRMGSCGVADVLGWDGTDQSAYQQDDLLSFGKLIIALACGSTSSVHNLPKSVDHIARIYSPDLKNVVLYLLSKPGPRKTVEEVLALLGGRVLDELNASFVAEDSLESELMRELENGRLVRLLTKFGFINERPEFDHDPRWAETGDRYIIKLFRDFVFHQVDENGRPVTDLSHVISSLNKLDAGIEEKIMLVSRDEQSCLIVSYREIKNCIDTAFLDLSR